jgi:uncharacterized membrane protein
MTEQHRATADQWAYVRTRADDMVAYSTILELLHRIEALEVAAKPNHPAKPDSSLVDQVEDALDMARGDSEAKARAAILEVAAWLRVESEGHFGSGLHWSQRLEQEAKR